MKRTGFTGYAYDFSVDYEAVAVDKEKWYSVNTSSVIKKMFLHMIMFIMQKVINNTYIVGVVKQINIKNRTYYFYNDIIDLKDFDARLLRIDKKSYKNIGIYNIGYITIKKSRWLWEYL